MAFAVLAAVQVTLIAAITIVVVALPDLRRGLGLDQAQAILVNTGYGLSLSGLLLLGARLGERWGLRRCLLAGLVVLVAGSLAGGLASGWWVLIAARLLQGVGAALAAPAAMGLLPVLFTDERTRGRALATWGVLASVGAMTGTLAGGVLTGVVSWRWCLLVVGMAAAAEFIATWLLVPSAPRRRTDARLDIAGAAAITCAVVALSYGLIQTADRPWTSPSVTGPVLAGLVLLTGFVVIERRAVTPLVDLPLLRNRCRVAGLVTIWITSAATAAVSLFCSLYFQQVQDRPPLGTTARLAPLGVIFALTAVTAGTVLRRFGSRASLIAGLTAAAIGLGLLSALAVGSTYAGPILAGLLIFPAGAGVAFAAGTVTAVSDPPQRDAASVAGLTNLAMETGPTVGVALLVTLASAVTGTTGSPVAVADGYSAALRAAAVALLAVAGLATALLIPTINRSRRTIRPDQSAEKEFQ